MMKHGKRDPAIRVGAWTFALIGLAIAMVALVVAGQALTRSNDAKETAALSSGVQVSLTEFALTPADIEVAADGSITVTNDGTADHNLAVKNTDLRTEHLSPGGQARLDLSSLDTGMYTVFCELPGHEAAGMTGMLMLGTTHGGATGAAAANAGINTKLNDEADERMAASTKAFPAATEGVGAQDARARLLPDGTKQFDLTAEIVEWEVEPGRTVEAWTYNGTVPAPTFRVEVGDRVRIALTNRLPESTVLHLHGLPNLPNAMDGVPDITQPPIKPGETFNYDFVANGPAIGMYHSHHHAAHQVPDGLFGAIYVGDLAGTRGGRR